MNVLPAHIWYWNNGIKSNSAQTLGTLLSIHLCQFRASDGWAWRFNLAIVNSTSVFINHTSDVWITNSGEIGFRGLVLKNKMYTYKTDEQKDIYWFFSGNMYCCIHLQGICEQFKCVCWQLSLVSSIRTRAPASDTLLRCWRDMDLNSEQLYMTNSGTDECQKKRTTIELAQL